MTKTQDQNRTAIFEGFREVVITSVLEQDSLGVGVGGLRKIASI